MIVIPATLTNSCVIREPELVINTKWPANERKTPTQNSKRLLATYDDGLEDLPFQPTPVLRYKPRHHEHHDDEMQDAIRGGICLVVRVERIE